MYGGDEVREGLELLAAGLVDADPDRRADVVRALRRLSSEEQRALVAWAAGYSLREAGHNRNGARALRLQAIRKLMDTLNGGG